MRKFSLLVLGTIIMSSYTEKGMVVTSDVFRDNSVIPVKYSCEGEDINPPLNISGLPQGTQSLALILHDPDAPMKGGFTHWVMWNIAPNTPIIERFKNAEQGMNSARKAGYIGMCPPTGTHHYHFTVYALDRRLTLPVQTDKVGLEDAMKGHIIGQATLTGLYKKIK